MYTYDREYDAIVVGGGHAGCEAALALSRMGHPTLLLTMNLDSIAQMSCNPAIGGLAKGHLVREVDALGGQMARVIDEAGIQFRLLNTKKGPAVWAPRAQADKKAYQFRMKQVLEQRENLDVKQQIVEEVLVKHGRVVGVFTQGGIRFRCQAVLVTTGTFLKGLVHIGKNTFAAGRYGEFPAERLSDSLRDLGFEIGRLKTGTPPRVNRRTIDFSQLQAQQGDTEPTPFSFSTPRITQPQIPCYIGYTNEKTHKLIRDNLDRAPLYSGQIKGVGPRYCPSIEDKVVRFAHKERHQVFFEPEGRNTEEVYLNGLATSIPADVQVAMLRTIKGLEKSEIMRFGYAIEYDYAPPTQLKPNLETKRVENLFFAGQINGTSGYEEAAAQGIMAGINVGLKLQEKEPIILSRSEAYIGVLIDDLVTKGVTEPYRMFTSRAEHRLLLRQDNADIRLMKYGHQAGLVSRAQYQRCQEKKKDVASEVRRLKGVKKGNVALAKILCRPEVSYQEVRKLDPGADHLPPEVIAQVELEIKYEGYIKRERIRVRRFSRMEKRHIPADIEYDEIRGLKTEAREKLKRVQPASLGQASRISGVSPCDISLLLIYLEQRSRARTPVTEYGTRNAPRLGSGRAVVVPRETP